MAKRDFLKRVQPLVDYYKEFHTLENIKQKDVFNSIKIGMLVANIRRDKNNGLLSDEEIEFLSLMDFKWDDYISFAKDVKPIKEWFKRYGNLENLNRYSKIEIDGKVVNIGDIVQRLRSSRKNNKLTLLQISFLDNLGFQWASLEEIYADLIQYYNEHGSIAQIPSQAVYTTYDGKTHHISRQKIRILKKFKDKKLTDEEFYFFKKLGLFDKVEENNKER